MKEMQGLRPLRTIVVSRLNRSVVDRIAVTVMNHCQRLALIRDRSQLGSSNFGSVKLSRGFFSSHCFIIARFRLSVTDSFLVRVLPGRVDVRHTVQWRFDKGSGELGIFLSYHMIETIWELPLVKAERA